MSTKNVPIQIGKYTLLKDLLYYFKDVYLSMYVLFFDKFTLKIELNSLNHGINNE